jgi:hypothetical protein
MTLLAATFLVVGPLAAQEQPGAFFIRGEYWTCPQENIEALVQTSDSIWAPILDGMVSEGEFVRWGWATPFRAFHAPSEEAELQEVEPKWDLVVSFTAKSEEAFDSAWEEYFARLTAKFPGFPSPWQFCDGLVVVDYWAPAPR